MATGAPRPALPLFWFPINVRSPSSEFPLVIKIEQGASMCKQEQVVVFQFLIVKKIHHLLKAGMVGDWSTDFSGEDQRNSHSTTRNHSKV